MKVLRYTSAGGSECLKSSLLRCRLFLRSPTLDFVDNILITLHRLLILANGDWNGLDRAVDLGGGIKAMEEGEASFFVIFSDVVKFFHYNDDCHKKIRRRWGLPSRAFRLHVGALVRMAGLARSFGL
jgi:hypothetical protein